MMVTFQWCSPQEKQLRVGGSHLQGAEGFKDGQKAFVSELLDVDVHDAIEKDEVA